MAEQQLQSKEPEGPGTAKMNTVLDNVLGWFSASAFKWNRDAMVFAPAAFSDTTSLANEDPEDAPTFSKRQVKAIIDETSRQIVESCDTKAAELYMPKVEQLSQTNRDLVKKMAEMEEKLVQTQELQDAGAELQCLQKLLEVKRLRDEGLSVETLITKGYSIGAIQRDDSNSLCQECCRPRHMCSCTYMYMGLSS